MLICFFQSIYFIHCQNIIIPLKSCCDRFELKKNYYSEQLITCAISREEMVDLQAQPSK